MSRRNRMFPVLAVMLAASCGDAHAMPLDADACVRLKEQRDALQANGLRDLINQRPTGVVPPERLKKVRQLINLDGQLRFRCNMDLLLPTLKPDPVDEFVDAGDTAGRPLPKATAAKRVPAKKIAAPSQTDPAAATVATGSPAPQKPKTAAAKAGLPTDAAPEPSAKPRAKADDAFRPPASGDANGTPLDKQVPKSR